MEYVGLAIRLLVGSLLLLSFLGKSLAGSEANAAAVGGYKLLRPSLAPAASRALLVIEVALSSTLISGIFIDAALVGTACLFRVFRSGYDPSPDTGVGDAVRVFRITSQQPGLSSSGHAQPGHRSNSRYPIAY